MSELCWLECSLMEVPETDEWLSGREREVLAALRLPKRRREWRLGRFTAKLALRRAWPRLLGIVAPPDLEVIAATDGAPEAHTAAGPAPALSLSHSGDRAVCLVSAPGAEVGCDLEQLEERSAGLVRDFFTPAEQGRIADLAPSERTLAANLVWSAKESTLKARRVGLRESTLSVDVSWEGRLEPASWQPFDARDRSSGLLWRGWWRTEHGFVATALGRAASVPPTLL